MSFVYVMTDESGRVKVGRSRRPEWRLIGVRSVTGGRVVLVSQIPMPPDLKASDVERTTHYLLWDKHHVGEWFNVSADDALARIREAIELVRTGFVAHVRRRKNHRDAPLSVRLPSEVKAALSRAADKDGRTMSQYVDRIIVAHLKATGRLQ